MSQQAFPHRLVTQKEVLRLIGIGSRETLSRWIRLGHFPAPILVGGGRLRWVLAEVEHWVEARMAQRVTGKQPQASLPKPQDLPMPDAGARRRHV